MSAACEAGPAAGVANGRAAETGAVQAVAKQVVRLVNEVVAGARPAGHVLPLFTLHLRGTVRRAQRTRGGVPRLRHLLITSHRDGVYEIVAVCRRGGRVSAIGLQLTRRADGRWEVTDVAHPQLGTATGPVLSEPPSRTVSR